MCPTLLPSLMPSNRPTSAPTFAPSQSPTPTPAPPICVWGSFVGLTLSNSTAVNITGPGSTPIPPNGNLYYYVSYAIPVASGNGSFNRVWDIKSIYPGQILEAKRAVRGLGSEYKG